MVTNRVLFLEVGIRSNRFGDYSFPLIYIFAENESFCAEIMMPNNAKISHIIHVRYGGGHGGGGGATGAWLINVLRPLGCEVFISDGHTYWREGDYLAAEIYPALTQHGPKPYLEIIRVQQGESWSNHGDVTWNLVS